MYLSYGFWDYWNDQKYWSKSNDWSNPPESTHLIPHHPIKSLINKPVNIIRRTPHTISGFKGTSLKRKLNIR